MANKTQKPARRWVMILFGMPFLLAGLGVLVMSPLDTLRLHLFSAGWERVPARLTHVELISSRGDDTTTYRVAAQYDYVFAGRTYQGTRVGYDTASDSFESDHRQLAARLRTYKTRGEPVLAWVNPADPQQALLVRELRWKKLIFSSIFGLIFALVGGVIVLFGVRHSRYKTPAEITGPIYSAERYSFWVWLGIGVLFWLMPSPAFIEMPDELRAGNRAILLVLIFPLVGSVLLWLGLRGLRNWRHYGPLPVALDPQPGQIGGDVGGRIFLRMPRRADNPFTLTLQCLRSTVSGSGKNRSRRESLVWQAEQIPYLKSEAGGTALQFQFQPPEHLPATEPVSDNYHYWRLLLSAKDLPVPLSRTYTLPVQHGSGKTRYAIPAQDSAQLARQAALRALEQAGEQIQVSQAGGAVQIHSPFGLHIGAKLMWLLMGLIFAGAAVILTYTALHQGGMLWLMAVVFSLVGYPLLLGGFIMLGRSLRVEVRNGVLRSVRYWFGLPLWRRQANLRRADQLTVKSSGTKTSDGRRHTEYFHLLVSESDRSLRIAEDIAGRQAAEALRDSLIQLLGLR